MAAGVAGGRADQSGSRSRIFAIVSETVSPGKRDAPGQHLVEDAAERPDVGALVDRLPARLLAGSCRRPCPECAFARPAWREPPLREIGRRRVGARRLREPEVEHLHHAVRRDLDVRGLQVAVDDPFFVRGLERLGDLARDRQRFGDRQPWRA